MIKKLTQIFFTITGILIVAYSFYDALSTKNLEFDIKFLNIPSATLIIYSLLGILFCSFRIQKIIRMFSHLIFSSQIKSENQLKNIHSKLKEISDVYYKNGPGALLQYSTKSYFPPVWKMVFEKLEANINPQEISDFVLFGQETMEQNYEEEINILRNLSQIAPSLGLLGTVIGLIKLLAELQDFNSVGPNMSLALVTTLYGLFISIIIINPLINRLEDIKQSSLKFYDLAVYWLNIIDKRMPSVFVDAKNIGTR